MRRYHVLLLAVVATLCISQAALAADLFGPIRVAANRSKYVGACPVDIVFTGNINLTSPHPKGFVFNYHWERSDGAKGAVTVVKPPASQNMLVVKDPWTVGAAGKKYDLSVKLFVDSGNTHLEQASPVIPVTCK